MNKHLHRERGVVLLTCLVFLMVLLAMLRFALTSALVEEQKSGIDLEILSARTSAQLALNEAERLILQEGEAFCMAKDPSKPCKKDAAKYASLLFGNLDHLKANRLYNHGIYSAEAIRNSGCEPFWTCVKWSNQAKAVQEALTAAKFEAINCQTCNVNQAAATPQYVIEHFFIEDLNSGSASATNKSKSIVLRITALGFGRGPVDSSELSSALIQSTYLFPNNASL